MRSYEKLTLSHDGFYNGLYKDLRKVVTINKSYKTLVNSGQGIAYELYKIIKINLPKTVTMNSYQHMVLSKEGVGYWLVHFAKQIPEPTKEEEKNK